jgi:hypothetical protein
MAIASHYSGFRTAARKASSGALFVFFKKKQLLTACESGRTVISLKEGGRYQKDAESPFNHHST